MSFDILQALPLLLGSEHCVLRTPCNQDRRILPVVAAALGDSSRTILLLCLSGLNELGGSAGIEDLIALVVTLISALPLDVGKWMARGDPSFLVGYRKKGCRRAG